MEKTVQQTVVVRERVVRMVVRVAVCVAVRATVRAAVHAIVQARILRELTPVRFVLGYGHMLFAPVWRPQAPGHTHVLGQTNLVPGHKVQARDRTAQALEWVERGQPVCHLRSGATRGRGLQQELEDGLG